MSDQPQQVPSVSRKTQAPRRLGQWRVRREALTTQQCADALGCSRHTVMRDISAGLMAAHVVGGNRDRRFVRVDADDLLAFVAFDAERHTRVARWLAGHVPHATSAD